MNQLIAFTGLAGSGKSTAAQALSEQFGFKRMSFATPMRAMLLALGLTQQQMTFAKAFPVPALGGRTPRELMQTLGTEWGRKMVHPDIWANLSHQRILNYRAEKNHGIVFDDCRFDNEANLIHSLGGLVIEVTREGTARMTHASEAGLSRGQIDHTIFNALEREKFQQHVIHALNAL